VVDKVREVLCLQAEAAVEVVGLAILPRQPGLGQKVTWRFQRNSFGGIREKNCPWNEGHFPTDPEARLDIVWNWRPGWMYSIVGQDRCTVLPVYNWS
jgi:hypothetical protein